jgi:hypothetical protein
VGGRGISGSMLLISSSVLPFLKNVLQFFAGLTMPGWWINNRFIKNFKDVGFAKCSSQILNQISVNNIFVKLNDLNQVYKRDAL